MELVSRCVECGLAEPESLASLGGSAPGVVDGILSSVATASLRLGRLKTGLRDLKYFLMLSWVCGAVPCLVVTLKVSWMLDGDVHAKEWA